MLRPVLALALLTSLAVAGCSSGSEAGDKAPSTTRDQTPATVTAGDPDGSAATLTELSGGDGIFLPDAMIGTGTDLGAAGWVEHEYAASGEAVSYEAIGKLPSTGRFRLTERDGVVAEYRTRVVVRRPEKAADFNGTVAVEWLNVSGGIDANPDYLLAGEELVREGTAWVGVSAQLIGVEGGEVAVKVDAGEGLAGKGLKGIDPERYGSLEHPGDAFAYDIYTQVARALRGKAGAAAMGGFDVERVLAIGESQSAFALTTYANGVQPLTLAFDGFLIHSRGGAALPLGEPDEAMSIESAIGGPAVRIRTDLGVPVLIVETETDVVSVIGYYPARQPDTRWVHLWEVAGTAHADATLLGPTADTVDCGVPINHGPQQYAVRAAIHQLVRWVETGEAPTPAPRLDVVEEGGAPVVQRDADGVAKGGIRLPQVAVPVDVHSGQPNTEGGVICLLLGSTTPLPQDRLDARYASRDAYLDAYEAATEEAIEAGFAAAADRKALLDDAEPDRISEG